MLAFALIMTLLAACGAPLEPGRGKNEGSQNEIHVIGGGEKTVPHSVLRYSRSYAEETKQWLSADGAGAFESAAEYLQKNEDKIPAVIPENVEIDMSSNGTLGKVEIYRKADTAETRAYDLKNTITLGETDIFADAKAAFSVLTEGTYYIALYVDWKGDFIETDNGGQHEASGYVYYFKITV